MSNTDPVSIAPSDDQLRLRIEWGDAHVSELEPYYLRLQCPCAACVEEMTGRPLLDPRTVDPGVYPLEIEYVGRYALQFRWSDGHSTGIYPFEMLRKLCTCEICEGSAAQPS